jgi:hypothetical protein
MRAGGALKNRGPPNVLNAGLLKKNDVRDDSNQLKPGACDVFTERDEEVELFQLHQPGKVKYDCFCFTMLSFFLMVISALSDQQKIWH